MAKMFNEGAMRPNESKNHVSATNAEQWDTIEVNSAEQWEDLPELSDFIWFDIVEAKRKRVLNADYTISKYEYDFKLDGGEVSSVTELVEMNKRVREYCESLKKSADKYALTKFYELIKNDENYDVRMKFTDNLSTEMRKTRRQSGDFLGTYILNRDTKDEVVYYKYAISEDASLETLASIWKGTKDATKVIAAKIKADAEKQAAERRAREEAEKREAEKREMDDMRRQIEELKALIAKQNAQ